MCLLQAAPLIEEPGYFILFQIKTVHLIWIIPFDIGLSADPLHLISTLMPESTLMPDRILMPDEHIGAWIHLKSLTSTLMPDLGLLHTACYRLA